MRRRMAGTQPPPVEHLDATASAKLHRAASYLDAALSVDVNSGLADLRRRAGTSRPRPTGQVRQHAGAVLAGAALLAICGVLITISCLGHVVSVHAAVIAAFGGVIGTAVPAAATAVRAGCGAGPAGQG
jgi:hypothetical protein